MDVFSVSAVFKHPGLSLVGAVALEIFYYLPASAIRGLLSLKNSVVVARKENA